MNIIYCSFIHRYKQFTYNKIIPILHSNIVIGMQENPSKREGKREAKEKGRLIEKERQKKNKVKERKSRRRTEIEQGERKIERERRRDRD